MTDLLKKIAAKDYLGAHGQCMDMIHQNVHDPRPYHILGVIAFDHKNIAKAAELFARAAELDSSNPVYWAENAKALSVLGRQDEARTAIEKAAALPIKDPQTADTIAVVYSRVGFHERAIVFFQQAIELNPNPANFHYNLGSSLQFSGRFSEAKTAYLATIERESDFFKAYTGLVALEKQTVENNYLPILTALFDDYHADPDAALHIGHAIAKTHEDMGDYPQSLRWLKKAKTLHQQRFPVDLAAQRSIYAVAKETSDLVPQVSAHDTTESAPIFIVGLPRTGTTLVDRIMSSHPDVTSAGELNVFAGLIKAGAQTRDNTVLDAATLGAAASVDFAQVGQRYVASTEALTRGSGRFTDKMPLNFFYAALILKAMPNARIITLRRSAMDSCLSNYRQLFSTQFSYYNYTFDLESTAQFYRGFDALTAHWRAVLPANRFTEVHYEDIVHDQENQTRRLLEFCDLSWDEACMNFHENAMPVSTASSVQVRQKLYSGSIGRWKRYGTNLDPLKKSLGSLADKA